MGLDIYAGPLCRYYTGQWQTVIQQWGAANGVPVNVVRPGSGGLAGLWRKLASVFSRKAPSADPVAAIVAWREYLTSAGHLPVDADRDWPEALDVPCDTDKPDFDGYGAVQIWAAYMLRPRLVRPQQFQGDWENDPALTELSQSPSEFDQIIRPELWLPVEFQGVFEAEDPGGKEIKIGSVYRLWDQMCHLNDRSWGSPEGTIRKWREEEFNPEDLDSIARWGFSIWYCLT